MALKLDHRVSNLDSFRRKFRNALACHTIAQFTGGTKCSSRELYCCSESPLEMSPRSGHGTVALRPKRKAPFWKSQLVADLLIPQYCRLGKKRKNRKRKERANILAILRETHHVMLVAKCFQVCKAAFHPGST